MPSKTPAQYKTSLKDLDSRYKVILNEVTSAFPYAKAYPDLSKYTSAYDSDNGNLTKLQADLFLLIDSLQTDINDTSKSMERIVCQINQIENKNFASMKKLNSLADQSSGAQGMFQDSRFIYNYKYYENLTFLLIIAGLGYTFYKSMDKGVTLSVSTF